MAKAKLTTVTKRWIDGKTEKLLNIKTERQKDTIKKVMQTIHISKEASKLLWYNRAETGESISHTVERLIMERLGKKQRS